MEKELITKIVTLEPESHTYSDELGQQYASWSSRIKKFQEPFNTQIRSRASAKKQLRETLQREPSESEVTKQAKVLEKSWEENNKDSRIHGTGIHNQLEKYGQLGQFINGPVSEQCVASICSSYLTGYRDRFFEQVIYSLVRRNAGTTDFVGVRSWGKKPVVDLKDFKTNKSKGIQYSSSYGNRLLGPLSFLEDCNYNTYSLQLSDYALMLEEEHGFQIGRLSIIYIPFDDPMMHIEIPVTYMREEVKLMNNHLQQEKKMVGGTTVGNYNKSVVSTEEDW